MGSEPFRIEGETGPFEVVVGLEVHAQIVSRSKLFSGAATAFGAEPNTQVSLVDAALPGMLPVLNGECVRQAVRTGLALGCRINRVSRFDRKNYFYPDLPAGYQISQYKEPIVGEGVVEVELDDGTIRRVGIERIHLEQDAGKSIHDLHPSFSLVDLNRAGVALMEIVSRPDLRSPAEAGAYVATLRQILRAIGACDGNMQEGSLRADINVSVRRPGTPLGTRCEIKNVNSIRFIQQAVACEAARQVAVIEAGGAVQQETRLFDPERGETRPLRSKEDAHDYRYFPDPDLLPLELSEAFIEECRASLPELPAARRRRYQEELGLSPYLARVLTADVAESRWFEALLAATATRLGQPPCAVAERAANWMTGDLFAALKRLDRDIETSPVTPEQGAELLALAADGTLSGPLQKQVFEIMLETGENPGVIAATRGLRQVSDAGAIEAAVARVLAAEADKVAEYRAGKEKLFGFFVGQVMKATGGKANPQLVNAALRRALAAETR
ncbi:MAG: Asp-tRNA(Asn)/Glu-tRNA(Gln) amidotransferase subunit GatB [Sphingomonadaceae bacterium]|uniref:Asp-tRNA(Asn)/Glu-tRNA(Gln) amidotransferase subunit GatB n=1 Tax=Thermaurantiacus sp. TaxID=2820283 RepID=UPI00298F2340|nr:Asp-tRNA(Asn)/Glu-tRNA(Gln) amidotransferase subunit GatB [Thermaurantiacus sp.]MCS6987043.1 Asp-tRNA(Asn)/Glu-tRNA(Gln) amidotransferase subunit GatB [Sphingomonadaceae bacterium]MDW8415619.1 Asp-tRNA(Asn)/Glu-tRNA(Gln) amidotransferase subunit GatB [Thermaurantiacus sp.]